LARVRIADTFLVLCIAAGAGCAASPPPVETIEPPTGAAAAAPASASASAPAPAKAENDFVLSRAPVAPNPSDAEDPQIHINDKWWRFRGDFLKLTERQVRDRDASISPKQAPQDFWDPQTAFESVSIWGALCNQCHGGRRRVEDAVAMTPPPANWGQGEGLFFGNRRPYADVFGTIHNGGPQRDNKRPMPAWRNILSREQIWALLYFLEFQSGGIEGRFPPSLYPRMRSDHPLQ
jgi:mono/diheme cytochrome c family protein